MSRAVAVSQAAPAGRGGEAGWLRAGLYYVDVVGHLVRRDFAVRYTRSVLGALWSVLPALTQLLVLVFLFQKVLPLGIDGYPGFVFSGLLPWTWFSSAVSGAGSLFVSNRDLVRRPNFASALLIVVNTLANLLTYLLSLPILFALLLVYGHHATSALLALPVLLLVQSALIIGVSLVIATVNVFYRDVQHLTSVAVALLFYLTPVFYQPRDVSSAYRLLLFLNPMAVLVTSFRAVTFYGRAPEWPSVLLAAASSLVVCAVGYLVYRWQRPNIADAL